MLVQKDSKGQSLLANAALGGDESMFETVLNVVHAKLHPDKV